MHSLGPQCNTTDGRGQGGAKKQPTNNFTEGDVTVQRSPRIEPAISCRPGSNTAQVIHKNLLTARNPLYNDPNIRMKSFRDWPANIPIEPKCLVAAGFYFTEHQDTVRCWFCDIGVRNWSRDDDPFVEHARWSPDCQFVIQEKGKDFMSQVKIAHANKQKMEEVQLNDDEYKRSTTDSDLECSPSVMAENASVRKQLMCLVCGVKEKNVLFLPCSHLELCEECGMDKASCPRCQLNTKQKIKTHRY